MVNTPNKFLEQPIVGTLPGTWDAPLNSNTGVVDNSFGGLATIALLNSPVTLSSGQYQCVFLKFTGVLTASVPITLPPIGSFYTIINETTNSSAFYVTMQTSVAGGRVIGLPPGNMTEIMTDGIHTRFKQLPAVGSYWDYAGSSTPSWIDICTIPPWLYCNGSAFSSSTYPNLAVLLNGTTLPDFRGRAAFQLNDGTSRLESSVGGLDGNTIFASGGSQTVTLSSRNIPNISFPVTDPGHTHTVSHNANSGTTGPEQSGVAPIGDDNAGTVTISSNTTGITVNSGGSGVPFSNVGPSVVAGIRLIRAS